MSKHRRKWRRKNPPQIKVLRNVSEAKLPTKARDSDHCFDFYAAESITIRPGETVIVPLGLKVELPKGYALVFKERSGLACKGIIVGAGVIDEEYRGSLNVVLRWIPPYDNMISPTYDGKNHKNLERYMINVGDKIAQAKLERTLHVSVVEVTEKQFSTNTHRGEKGFGSSGTR